mmetsp:Transcript_23567/g.75614  ORF Transcript_23567/g.75614 Transcript_23567/m.75614 type:complete len:216 (-) Transcript_23567:453-1100(-)
MHRQAGPREVQSQRPEAAHRHVGSRRGPRLLSERSAPRLWRGAVHHRPHATRGRGSPGCQGIDPDRRRVQGPRIRRRPPLQLLDLQPLSVVASPAQLCRRRRGDSQQRGAAQVSAVRFPEARGPRERAQAVVRRDHAREEAAVLPGRGRRDAVVVPPAVPAAGSRRDGVDRRVVPDVRLGFVDAGAMAGEGSTAVRRRAVPGSAEGVPLRRSDGV